MRRSLLVRQVIPFVISYFFLFIIAVFLDFVLHKFNLVWVGRYLGIAGTGLLLLSFLYSMRKRRIIKFGSPRRLLTLHEYLAYSGVIMILVHAGIHFNAIIPWVALIAMLLVAASGHVGKFLLRRSLEQVRLKREALLDSGLSEEAAEKEMFLDSLTIGLMRNWRAIHIPINMIFASFAIIHIISILFFWKW